MSHLDELLAEKRIIVVLGTGGVGKTTIASAIATGVARHRKTLVLTVDPAQRLKDALVPGPGREGLPAVDVLDVRETMQRLVRFLAPDEEIATRIIENRFFQFIDRGLPGVHHYTGIFRVLEALNHGGYEVVVVDTPPMGHAVEFLTAADRIVRAGKILGMIAGPSSRRFSLRAGLPRLVIRTLKRFLGGDFAGELLEFFDLMHQILVRFEDQAVQGRALLTSEDAALLLVTAPDRDATGDTAQLLQDLPEGHVIYAALLNRVLPGFDEEPKPAAARLMRAMDCIPGAKLWLHAVGRDVQRSVERSLTWYKALGVAQDIQIKEVLALAPELGIPRMIRVPSAAGEVETPEGLRALYDAAEPVDRASSP